jgi:putative endonuclease
LPPRRISKPARLNAQLGSVSSETWQVTRATSRKKSARSAKRPASPRAKSPKTSTAPAGVQRHPEAASAPVLAQAASPAKEISRQAATESREAIASARSSPQHRSDLARRGEALVASLLEERGFSIYGRNVRVGRLELDVIAQRGTLVVVCEVRSRTTANPVHPAATIDRKKLERVRRATAIWLRRQKLGHVHARIDAAAVVFDQPREEPRIEYYENVSFPMWHA